MKRISGIPEARDSLTRQLSLKPMRKYCQDWDLETADSSRVDEFVSAYNQRKFSAVEKLLLMELIVATFDEALRCSEPVRETLWNEISELLINDYEIHDYTIYYWSLWELEALDEDFGEHCFFHLTPKMREISNILKARGLEYTQEK